MPNDDEFKNVIKGLPEESTPQKKRVNFVILFTISGVVIASLILLFQEVIKYQGEKFNQSGTMIPEQIILNAVLALFVGSLQAWIFKNKIKSRAHVFIASSFIGGCIAGFVGGILIDSGLKTPLVIGLVNGAFSGGISSLGQNSVMRNQKYKSKWFIFSVTSWAIIFSISWVVGWRPESVVYIALSALFLLIASGVSLFLFINNTPQIEFS